jgi:hypothetical protein
MNMYFTKYRHWRAEFALSKFEDLCYKTFISINKSNFIKLNHPVFSGTSIKMHTA